MPTPTELRCWYEEKYLDATGEPAPAPIPGSHLWAVLEYLDAHPEAELERLAMVRSSTEDWPQRRNRAPHERLAVKLGELRPAGGTATKRVLFLVPPGDPPPGGP